MSKIPSAMDGGRPMDISFIVCTHNRVKSLAHCLASIDAQVSLHPKKNIELIVVNNNSTDSTSDFLAGWQPKSKIDLKLLTEKKSGLAAARNAGVAASSGQLIAFTDDDCRLGEHYIKDLLQHFVNDPGPAIRGGRVELGDPADLNLTVKRGDTSLTFEEPMHPGTFILGCNMVIHRRVFAVAQAFDERFGAGAPFMSGEETEFFLRAHEAGIKIYYVPNMVVHHFHGRRTPDVGRNLIRGALIANGAIFAKHFKNPLLLRHFYWDFKKSLAEFFGGETFSMTYSIKYRDMVYFNIIGIIRYVRNYNLCSNLNLGDKPLFDLY